MRLQTRFAVVAAEGLFDSIRVAGNEVQNAGFGFVLDGSVQTRQSLHGTDAGQRFVDIHRVQQRLIETGLELVRNDQQTVRLGFKLAGRL